MQKDLAQKLNQIKKELKEKDKDTAPEAPIPKEPPKLLISGQLDRKKHKYISCSCAVLEPLYNDIKKHCRGGSNAIFNYLMQEGLKNIKASEETIIIEAKDIEM